MANVWWGELSWVGDGFDPGVEHYWWAIPCDFGTNINVMAHSTSGGVEREVMIKDIRTNLDASGGRRLFFTVRNTGPNTIVGYELALSFIQQ
jgi:hypothetical protein